MSKKKAAEDDGAAPTKKHHQTAARQRKQRAKLTKEERRAKYTQLARDRKERQLKQSKARHLTCFHCRRKGHTVDMCRATTLTTKHGAASLAAGMCYRCGSTEHGLAQCPSSSSLGLPYATCFVCHEKGHLASTCPRNDKGIYVHGGACQHCGSNHHKASNCPGKAKKQKGGNDIASSDDDDDADSHSDLLSDVQARQVRPCIVADVAAKKKRRVVNF